MTGPRLMTGMVATAVALADRAVISDIECEGVQVPMPDGARWYDISAMLSEEEHSPQHIDMAIQGLGYAVARGLIDLHPVQTQLVRIVGPTDTDRALVSTFSPT